jgi:hypothetical protein
LSASPRPLDGEPLAISGCRSERVPGRSAMLDAASIEVFELATWQAWTGVTGS